MNKALMSASVRLPAVCLLGASYRTGNRGVAALASGTVNSVMHCFPGARVFLLDYDRQPRTQTVRFAKGSTDVESVNVRFSWRVWQCNNIARLLLVAVTLRLVPVAMVQRWLIGCHPHLRRVLEADIIASIGGGDSFADVYGLTRLFYVSLPQILVLVLNKPLVQLPQTIGPFDGVVAKMIARYILRRASQVYSRDRESLIVARQLMGRNAGRLDFAFDMAFALEPVRPRCEDLQWFSSYPDKPLVGLNLSGLLYVDEHKRNNRFQFRTAYRSLVRQLLSLFLEQLNSCVVLIPHAHRPDDTSESDTIACKAALHEWTGRHGDRLHYVDGDHSEGEIGYLIGRCDFFVGSRMHACIAALSQAVPAIGLAYSGKFIGVWRSIDLEELVLDLRSLDSATIVARTRTLFDSRRRMREKLEEKMPAIRNSVLNLFSRMALDRST